MNKVFLTIVYYLGICHFLILLKGGWGWYWDFYFPITKGFSRKKYLGGVGTPSIIWGTTTRILIIFGVPPHKYIYLKWPSPRK